MPWGINLGPVSVGSSGFDIKPQLKLGAEGDNFDVGFGVSDVRKHGWNLGATAKWKESFSGSGNTLVTFLESIKADGASAEISDLVNDIIRQNTRLMADVAKLIPGADVNTGTHFSGKMVAVTGMDLDGHVWCGWDDEGYLMQGVGAEILVGKGVAVSVAAGAKDIHTQPSIKMIICVGAGPVKGEVACKVSLPKWR